MDALREAIECLYETFRRYPLKTIESCPCCTEPALLAQLNTQPLRELDRRTLDRYAMSAMLTMGDVDDLRHFLPRLLEVLAADADAFTLGPAEVIWTLRYADWGAHGRRRNANESGRSCAPGGKRLSSAETRSRSPKPSAASVRRRTTSSRISEGDRGEDFDGERVACDASRLPGSENARAARRSRSYGRST